MSCCEGAGVYRPQGTGTQQHTATHHGASITRHGPACLPQQGHGLSDVTEEGPKSLADGLEAHDNGLEALHRLALEHLEAVTDVRAQDLEDQGGGSRPLGKQCVNLCVESKGMHNTACVW